MHSSLPYILALFLSLGLPSVSSLSQIPGENTVEVRVKGVTMAPDQESPIVVLEDIQSHRAFPIWIGLPEARAIAFELEGILPPRPLTHTLLKDILTTLQVNVQRIVISDMREHTFYASIILRQGEQSFTIDARPSDAIALALQSKAPIFVASTILDAVPTVILQESPSTSSRILGMQVQEINIALATALQLDKPGGVLVAAVQAPAAAYGVRRGDVITGVDGKAIDNIAALLTSLQNKNVGQAVRLQVIRDRHPVELHFVISSLE